jgi:hypothetical protein
MAGLELLDAIEALNRKAGRHLVFAPIGIES